MTAADSLEELIRELVAIAADKNLDVSLRVTAAEGLLEVLQLVAKRPPVPR